MTLINIQDDIIRLNSMGVLNKLLVDKTTQKNIMWATDAYAEYGPKFERNEQIESFHLIGDNVGIIKTRARKEFEQQNKRTRQRAEVFTPLWICNYMNNYVDDQWFDRKGVFNTEGVPTDKVLFSDSQSWKDYVDSKRLEITCGEAPYLVSRYDVSSGELIPIKQRIGILDRKIRVITENTTTYDEWFFWVTRAYQATYGYEFQGDNLLIARVNLIMTLFENVEMVWNKQPTIKEVNTIINIITWNLWQMDGLTGTIPFKKAQQ
jgi:type II restriction enzyme